MTKGNARDHREMVDVRARLADLNAGEVPCCSDVIQISSDEDLVQLLASPAVHPPAPGPVL